MALNREWYPATASCGGKGETIRFSLDRQDYEIDLAEQNAKVLRDAFGKYVSAARRTAGTRGTGAGRSRGRTGAGVDADQHRRTLPALEATLLTSDFRAGSHER